MLYIHISSPDKKDQIALYDRAELDGIVGEYNAAQLENGVPVFVNGAIYVNAMAAAAQQANDFLMDA